VHRQCDDFAVVTITSSAGTTTRTLTLTAKTAISANAGGNVASSTLGPGAVVGQTIYFDTVYDFGGSDIGDEFMFQPSGGQTFNAGCFRMVGSRVMASNITPVVIGTTDRLYFLQTQKQSGNGYTATIRYYFEYQCANTTTTARPYAMQTSGNSLKYTGNFDGTGSISISFPGATNPFTITKTEDRSFALVGTSATVKYTVTISNPSAYASRISQIVDTLPAGATFAAIDASSQVTAANSSSVPAAGATGSITFLGKQDVSYAIAAGGSVTLIYTVTMPSTAGAYTNSARGYFGQATTATASATFNVHAPAPITVVKASQAYSDPANGTTNAKLIPGSYAHYVITVANPAPYPIDSDSIIVTDPTPTNLALFVNNLPSTSAPVLFQQGGTSSTLTFTYTSLSSSTDDVDFSSNGGSTWTYTPAPDASGFDSAVTNIRIRPKGTMAASSSFSLTIRYKVELTAPWLFFAGCGGARFMALCAIDQETEHHAPGQAILSSLQGKDRARHGCRRHIRRDRRRPRHCPRICIRRRARLLDGLGSRRGERNPIDDRSPGRRSHGLRRRCCRRTAGQTVRRRRCSPPTVASMCW
jgi:uncharacterized repeat protein (TIGR01451 family)